MLENFDPAKAVSDFYATQAPQKDRKADRHKDKARGNRHKSSWTEKHFIAWDGEGKDVETLNEYGDRRHIYNFLANSEGAEIYDETGTGLSTVDCLDLLCDSAMEHPKAINVVFGGSYDMNMILRDIPREKMEEISKSDGRDFVTWDAFAIRFVQRKYLSIGRYHDPDRMFLQKPNGDWVRNFDSQIVLWDVIGFFQSSFISAVEGWLGKDWQDLKLIREGKEKRKDFAEESLEFIRKYNAAELRALVRLMEKVHEAMDQLGLQLSRWDGAGAVAAAINKKHDVKKWLGEARKTADPVQTACQHAYFGGRIELGRYGYHDGDIYHYDVNSAYPSAQRKLPQMLEGTWVRYAAGDPMLEAPEKLPHITCYLVRWDFTGMGLRFGPFPYRSEMQRKVLFPEAGMNWVWKPEVIAALNILGKYNRIEILEAWSWWPTVDYLPYAWIDDYYNRRKELVAAQKRDGVIRGEEKVIKLGLNSLYGKTAQRAGYSEKTGRIPPFHNLAYAGYITSETRSLLWSAAMQAPSEIICLATDGIFSRVPLELDCPDEKQLGKWEAQKHDGMMIAQSGFYWINDGGEWRGWSRGFDKIPPGPNYQAEMKAQIDKILTAWKKGDESVYFPCTRFITVKTALSGANWWERWCSWYSMRTDTGIIGRKLRLYPTGTKRVSQNGKPWREMVGTIPETNYTPDEMSMLYNIPWISEDDSNENAIDAECAIADE
jgi:hypothetical protein